MLRRDFLRAISAFAAAASAGGTAAAGFTPPTGPAAPEPAVWVPPTPAEPVISPACIVNLTLVRGDELTLGFVGFDGLGPFSDLGWWIGRLRGTLPVASNGTPRSLHATAEQTSLLRPGVVPWGIAKRGRLHGGPAPRTLITGTATILPDDLWRAEEEVLRIVPQMHPLGISERRGRYQVSFREQLPGDLPSRYVRRVAALVDHCRPTNAVIFNRGQGCQIDFEQRAML